MRHYCTYFDCGFLIQGLALWRSLGRADSGAVLWVLALDKATAETLAGLGDERLRVVKLVDLEREDPELLLAKANRTSVEYYFTLSPAWPRWLLNQPGIAQITYLDADLYFFGSPEPIFVAMAAARASVLLTEHRFPSWLRHYERHGRHNVGVLVFENDNVGRACLDDWRQRCLTWCHDRLEDGKYADQLYLDAWPQQFGGAVLVLQHPGVNLAPWNWAGLRIRLAGAAVLVEEVELIVFHFARFRPKQGDWRWQSGQLDYGVMPFRLRNAVYGPYWRALRAARAELAAKLPGFDFSRRRVRLGRTLWRAFPLALVFGGDWIRIGDRFFNFRGGLGRFSGRVLAFLRNAARTR